MCSKLSNENSFLKRNLTEYDTKMGIPQDKMYSMNVLGTAGVSPNLVSSTSISNMQLNLDDGLNAPATTPIPQNHKRKFINMDGGGGQHIVASNSMHSHMNPPTQYHIQNSVIPPTSSSYNQSTPGTSEYPTPGPLQIDNNNLYALRALQSFSPFPNTGPIPNSLHVSRPPSNIDLTGPQNQSNPAVLNQALSWHPSLFTHGYANSHIPPINLTPTTNTSNTNSIYGNGNSNTQHLQHPPQQAQSHVQIPQQSGDNQGQNNGQQSTIGYQSGSSSDGNSNGLSSDSPPSPTSSSSSSDNAIF